MSTSLWVLLYLVGWVVLGLIGVSEIALEEKDEAEIKALGVFCLATLWPLGAALFIMWGLGFVLGWGLLFITKPIACLIRH